MKDIKSPDFLFLVKMGQQIERVSKSCIKKHKKNCFFIKKNEVDADIIRIFGICEGCLEGV